MKPDPEADYWTIDDVAAYWDVKPQTVRSYRSRGRGELPKEDRMMNRTPVWRPATIVEFQRPGRGARTDLAPAQAENGPKPRSKDDPEGTQPERDRT